MALGDGQAGPVLDTGQQEGRLLAQAPLPGTQRDARTAQPLWDRGHAQPPETERVRTQTGLRPLARVRAREEQPLPWLRKSSLAKSRVQAADDVSPAGSRRQPLPLGPRSPGPHGRLSGTYIQPLQLRGAGGSSSSSSASGTNMLRLGCSSDRSHLRAPPGAPDRVPGRSEPRTERCALAPPRSLPIGPERSERGADWTTRKRGGPLTPKRALLLRSTFSLFIVWLNFHCRHVDSTA